jgi:hypothetical protein
MFGWKQWDIHLAKFKKKQINILEIGVYKGDALEKFAQVFLDSEPNSHYYGIDTWEGSPEYVGIDFKEIEKKTLEKKANSPSKARIHLIKQESTLALPMLLSKGLEFDIIFIDASHVAKDVLYDSVLCMRLLKEKGVINKVGGFIGLGKSTKLNDDFNKDYFTKIDVSAVSSISIGAKKAKLLSNHPTSSYKLVGEKSVEKIEILNAEDFWSNSKYLVITIEQ